MLADQSKLSNLSDKFDGRTPIRIHFLDNSSKVFLVNNETTVQSVIQQCLEKLGVQNASIEEIIGYFGLYESRDGASINGCLNMESLVVDVIKYWKEIFMDQTAKFLFMIRLYVPSIWGLQYKDVVAFRLNKPSNALSLDSYLEEAEVIDQSLFHLQFIQAVFNVITGRYPTTFEESLDLGALHFLIKFGNFNPESHKVGFLGNRIVEFVPIKHIKSAKFSLEEIEGKLLDKVSSYVGAATELASFAGSSSGALDRTSSELELELEDSLDQEGARESKHRDGLASNAESPSKNQQKRFSLFRRKGNSGLQQISPQRKYMETIYRMSSLYGFTFFKCTQRAVRLLPDSLFLGIHHQGVGIFDKAKKSIKMFYIENVFRWGFKPNQMFYFEINPDNEYGTGSLEFETNEGKVISDLLTDYALTFLKEQEAEDDRLEKMKNGTLQVHSTSAPPLPTAPQMSGASIGGVTSNALSGLSPPLPPTSQSESENHTRAAVKIQALARGFLLRNEWAREDSAILIQSIFRGYRARIHMSQLIEQMIQSGEL